MKQQRFVCWINVSQTPAHRQHYSIIIAFLLLSAGALAVGFRVYLCQAQAYAIIALSICTMAIVLLNNAHRRDSLVEIKKNVYCADLSKSSHIAVTPGRLSSDVISSYERLYFTRIRVWLPLVVWLTWIAYGTLFHSGKHDESVEHELLIDLAAVGKEIPSALRIIRLYSLSACGLLSVLLTQIYKGRGTSSIVAMSNSEKVCQTAIWIAFGTLLFFPAIESTAQALVPLRLMARTTLFYILFILSENVNRLVHYERWIICYQPFTQAILIAIQIALGRARPMKLNEERAKELASGVDRMAPPPPVPKLKKPNSIELITNELINYCAILQSAWILVAGETVYAVAFFQVLILLVLHIHMRKRIIAAAQDRSPDFFVVNQTIPPVLPFTTKNNFAGSFVAQQTANSNNKSSSSSSSNNSGEDTESEECSPRKEAPPIASDPISTAPIEKRSSRSRLTSSQSLAVGPIISPIANGPPIFSKLSEAVLCQQQHQQAPPPSTTKTTTMTTEMIVSSSPQAVQRRRNTPSPPSLATITSQILTPNQSAPAAAATPTLQPARTSSNNEARIRRLAMAALESATGEHEENQSK
jgi:hypothetical protein